MQVDEVMAQSPAFILSGTGALSLATELTNSTLRFPIQLALNRDLAAGAGLLPANSPTNVSYVELPRFLTLQGTVGDPKTKVDYLALAGLAAQSGASFTGDADNPDLRKAGNIMNTLGGLLRGNTKNTSRDAPAATTNTPPDRLETPIR